MHQYDESSYTKAAGVSECEGRKKQKHSSTLIRKSHKHLPLIPIQLARQRCL